MFYYLRDKEKKPIVTVCVLKDNNGNVARGVAVCSNLDSPRKSTGRHIAHGRATKALCNSFSDDDVERISVYKQIAELLETLPFQFKSEFNPSLTAYEEKLLSYESAN